MAGSSFPGARPSAVDPGLFTVVGFAWRIATLCAVLALAGGCASVPKGHAVVDTVNIQGTDDLDTDKLKKAISTRESPRFLGLFEGVVYDYEVFNRFALQRDLQRLERYYRARGYYKAHVRAAHVFYDDENKHVKVRIRVEPGPPTRVRGVFIEGLDGIPKAFATAARDAVDGHVGRGSIFDEDEFEQAEKALTHALEDNGYAWVVVRRRAEVDLPGDYATVRFDVSPGHRADYGKITIEGLRGLPESQVRRVLDLKLDDPYSRSELDAARQALLDLGVFSSVSVEPDLSTPDDGKHKVPIVVKVTPTRLHTLRLGAGAEADVIRTDVHVLGAWDDQNFFGGMRHFKIEVRPGLVLYPTKIPDLKPPTDLLPEENTSVELRQPGFVEARTTGFIRGEFNIYPVLLSANVDPSAPLLGYREIIGSTGVDRWLWKLYARPSWNIQTNSPFTYKGLLDPDLSRLVISYGEILLRLDFRDNHINPHKGLLIENTFQAAGGPFGGNVDDYRIEPVVTGYIPLPKDFTLALKAGTGLLFPQNYGTTLVATSSGSGPPADISRSTWVRDVQVGFFRNFYSGGPASNRGYPLRGIGPHGAIPFFSPAAQAQQLANSCAGDSASYNAGVCALPLGGPTMWEASAELRFPILENLQGATFCDASDVAPGRLQYRFDRPHLSCGIGGRYHTPVGPVRVDIGYRIPGLQTLRKSQGEVPQPTILGLPIAVALGIGEPF